jgi:hypothetical protein
MLCNGMVGLVECLGGLKEVGASQDQGWIFAQLVDAWKESAHNSLSIDIMSTMTAEEN